MNLMPLVDILQSANIGVAGSSLFVDFMPAECERGILLRNRLTGMSINYELPGYLKGEFQIIVRSHDYDDGKALMDQTVAALTLSRQQVESQFYNYCRPKSQPVPFPLSSGNFIEWTVYMDVNFVE